MSAAILSQPSQSEDVVNLHNTRHSALGSATFQSFSGPTSRRSNRHATSGDVLSLMA